MLLYSSEVIPDLSDVVNTVTSKYGDTGRTPEEEESYQASEYESFFNGEEPAAEEASAYTLTDADAASILHQLEVTNGLIGTQNAMLIVFAIYGLMRFFMRLVDHNIFHYI